MIDWAQIRQLEADIGTEDFSEVVDLFIAEVDEAVMQLAEDPPEAADLLVSALHFLKGSAYNLGFRAFGDYCSEGEKMAMDGDGNDVNLKKTIRLYVESKEHFFKQAAEHCSFVPE